MSNHTNLSARQPAYDIPSVFTERWSPRSFSEQAVPEDVLLRVFEAARWAPSAFNHQPWRFIVLNSQADRERLHPCISEFNLAWCAKAPVLVLIISEATREGNPVVSHSFDTGAAWAYLALAATMEGLVTHPMTGFDFEQARDILNIPEGYAIQALIAIGYQGSASDLPEQLQARETPNGRRPIEQSLYSGQYGIPWRGEK